ncbi:HyaD/HybD family hydrogenase maturation endopeptidase [Desulfuromonas carbonis]|uniref:hydrogenase maturation protease n=1 Tax=Desulfuromonas sp. DDH964 TaxID=1823759 RepID=UPI00078CE4CC|nr:hydrogenase maturation protease [Desulfuromonas sp. DDH964]AMV73650.1 periplasmically oriented, membrane-bound [NiFe]-hydrogenase maturation protease [Desulfuromonas sp. DDH964]
MIPALIEPARPPILVMGVGNILRQDDGFADAVLQRLEALELPESIELFDAGTSAIDLMDIFNGREKLVVIDAVRGGQPPGTLYRFSPEEVEAQALPMNSLHQVGLIETLRVGELVDCKPKSTVVIGVQPAATGLGIGLTPAVAAAVERAVALVLNEITNA